MLGHFLLSLALLHVAVAVGVSFPGAKRPPPPTEDEGTSLLSSSRSNLKWIYDQNCKNDRTPLGLGKWIQVRLLYRTVLYCTVLYCTVLYCTVLYCTVLYCTVLYCTVLYCTVLYCTVLYCTVLYCTVSFYATSGLDRGVSCSLCRPNLQVALPVLPVSRTWVRV